MTDMEIQNILWAVDGALFNTYPAVTYSFSEVLNEMGLSVPFNMIDGLVRQSFKHCLDVLSQRFKLDPDLLNQRFAESYRRLSPDNQRPFPDVREVCEFIHANSGSNICFTDSNLEFAQALIEAHQFSPLIDDILSVTTSEREPPDPAVLLVMLDKHGLNLSETLLVTSKTLDIQMGKLAGVRTCLFGKTESSMPADIQIEDYSGLLDLLTVGRERLRKMEIPQNE